MTAAGHRESLAWALAAIELHPDGDYSWFGERFPGGTSRILTWRLAERLYLDYYSSGEAAPAVNRTLSSAATVRADLLHSLAAANQGGGSLDPGWRVAGVEGATLRVERGGIALWVSPDSFTGLTARQPAPGDRGCLRLPKGLSDRSPGFYTALGDRGLDPADVRLRIYWSLRPEGAATAMRHVTGALNASRTPFAFKAVIDSASFGRCDAAVLYTALGGAARALRVAREFADEHPEALRDRTPALTRRIRRGLGVAEEPPGGEGFGLSRCRLIAQAVTDAWSHGRPTPDALMVRVEGHLAAVGISLEAPHRMRAPRERAAA